MGHSVRMRALAREVAARGADVGFTTSTPALLPFVHPFPCIRHLPNCDIFVVDTKTSDVPCLMDEFRSSSNAPIVYIDHSASHPNDGELLIFPHAHLSPALIKALQGDFSGRVLYGWDYVMLDAEVMQQVPIPYAMRQDGPIVFCAGGSDPDGTLEQMYAWAATLDIPTQLLFCFGAASQGVLHQLYEARFDESLCKDDNRHIVPFDRRYLHQAALVVGMFGQTTYECLWYQTPLLTFSRTIEDAKAASALASRCIDSNGEGTSSVTSLGHFTDMTQDIFCSYLTKQWRAKVLRQRMHAASIRLFDGHGTGRVADVIMQLGA